MLVFVAGNVPSYGRTDETGPPFSSGQRHGLPVAYNDLAVYGTGIRIGFSLVGVLYWLPADADAGYVVP